MKFISIDLESNQPSGTIIQIGAAAFDTDARDPLMAKFVCYVNPDEEINWDQPLNNGMTLGELLPFTQKEITEQGIAPDVAFTQFWQWVIDINCGRKFIQWGRHDMEALVGQSKAAGVFYPQRIKDFNLKKTYQFLYQPANKLAQKYGLSGALKSCNIGFEGTAHDAYVDAYNTGVLMLHIYRDLENMRKIKGLV